MYLESRITRDAWNAPNACGLFVSTHDFWHDSEAVNLPHVILLTLLAAGDALTVKGQNNFWCAKCVQYDAGQDQLLTNIFTNIRSLTDLVNKQRQQGQKRASSHLCTNC